MKLTTTPEQQKIINHLDWYISDYWFKNKRYPQSILINPGDVFELMSAPIMVEGAIQSMDYAFKHPEVIGLYQGILRIVPNSQVTRILNPTS